MTKIHELNTLGQSIWLDYINRSFIASKQFSELLDSGISGLTSNPTIFEKSIVNSEDYYEQFIHLARHGKSSIEIYTALVCEDIRSAADRLYPVYERTSGKDGYVSLEVNPLLAQDTNSTVNEAITLWNMVNRPNLMIKIPATKQGLTAITQVIANGINVNVTLIFSLERYLEVIHAYLEGLETRSKNHQQISTIHSVASFFVSRLDTKIDKLLDQMANQGSINPTEAGKLRGKAAVANARKAYHLFTEEFNSQRFKILKDNGANLQRPLWASTSTKNPAYPDTLYIQELIGPHTVNTTPLETLAAFLDHGEVIQTIDKDFELAVQLFDDLAKIGIDLDLVTHELELEGVALFSASFNSLINNLDRKIQDIL